MSLKENKSLWSSSGILTLNKLGKTFVDLVVVFTLLNDKSFISFKGDAYFTTDDSKDNLCYLEFELFKGFIILDISMSFILLI